jgi:hypothetical protein
MSTTTLNRPIMFAEPTWFRLETVIAKRVPKHCGQDHIVHRRTGDRIEWWLEFADYANGEGLLHAIYLGADSKLVDRVRRLLEKRKADFTARLEAAFAEEVKAAQVRRKNREQLQAT